MFRAAQYYALSCTVMASMLICGLPTAVADSGILPYEDLIFDVVEHELDNYRLQEGEFSAGEFTVPYTITAPVKAGRYPAVLLLHGYHRDHTTWLIHQIELAAYGYVAMAIKHDGSPRDRRTQAARAIKLLNKQPDVDTGNVAVVGTSMGGQVTMNLLAREPDANFKAAILVYPFLDGLNLSKRELAGIDRPYLHHVGQNDTYYEHSVRLDAWIERLNPTLQRAYFEYDELDFSERQSGHGYYFSKDRDHFSGPAIDSFVRDIQFLDWQLMGGPQPWWWLDPIVVGKKDLLVWKDM